MDIEIGQGQIISQTVNPADGLTYYLWSFNAVVDGQAGIVTFWSTVTDPAIASVDAAQFIEANPGTFEGISSNDNANTDGALAGNQDDGNRDDGDRGDGDDDDGALASNDDGFGDSA